MVVKCFAYHYSYNITHITFRHSHLDTGTAVLGYKRPPIPWMLTKIEVSVVNERFRSVVIPHGVHAFCTFKEGLLENRYTCVCVPTPSSNVVPIVSYNRSSCWRMISKIQVFMMIPVMFRGTVPGLLSGLTRLVYAIMLMCGRVISERKRRESRFGAIQCGAWCGLARCDTVWAGAVRCSVTHLECSSSTIILKPLPCTADV